MQEINKEITDRFNLEIKSITPYKDAYIIQTSKGKKILKKTSLSPGRVQFIHAVKEHLYSSNFKNLDRYLCTIDQEPCVTIDGSSFTMVDMIEGVECNFDNRSDSLQSARLLANMHKGSKGFVPPENCIPRDELGKLPAYFSKRLEEIKKLKKVATNRRSQFDYLFLEYYNYFYNLGEDAIVQLNHSRYPELVAKARQDGVFCHHDFTHHNIICSGDRYSIINFDFCCFELKVYDIANLLRRKMRRCKWDVQEAAMMIKEYNSIECISEDEFFIMKLILQFPQKFWRVVNKYYNTKRSWSEKSFIARLQEVIDEVEHHGKFMEKYDILTK